DGGLDGVGELVSLLRHDRERRQGVLQRRRELVDLGRRRVPSGEDAEVDADLDSRLLLLAYEQRNRRFLAEWTHAEPVSRSSELLTRYRSRGSQRNLYRVHTSPAIPHAARTARSCGRVQTPCPRRSTA